MFSIGTERGDGQTPTSTATPAFEVAAPMEAAPTDCGVAPKPMAIDPQLEAAIGAMG